MAEPERAPSSASAARGPAVVPPEAEAQSGFTHSEVLRLSLEEVALGPMIGLTLAQQRKQRGRPFVAYGMHWLLTIEKEQGEEAGTFNYLPILYPLSISVRDRGQFPLKGPIPIPGVAADGQERSFCFQKGEFCNLIGKQFPANVIEMTNIRLRLQSGTASGESDVSCFDETNEFGGYYAPTWRGVGQVVLQNHRPDPCQDGRYIQVSVTFLDTPRALCYAD